jgi:hypothetical protein
MGMRLKSRDFGVEPVEFWGLMASAGSSARYEPSRAWSLFPPPKQAATKQTSKKNPPNELTVEAQMTRTVLSLFLHQLVYPLFLSLPLQHTPHSFSFFFLFFLISANVKSMMMAERTSDQNPAGNAVSPKVF